MPVIDSAQPVSRVPRRRSGRFLERSLASLVDAMDHALAAEDLAHANGLLQKLDPRVKLLGALLWIAAAVASRSLWVILALLSAALILAICSRVGLGTFGKRVWIPVLVFTGAISLPAVFVTSGRIMGRVPILGWPVTAQGIRSAAYLVGRAESAATLAVLLAVCTPWNHVLKALRVFRLPAVIVVILGMTYRYILLFLGTARDMFESRQSRLVGRLNGGERRRIAAAGVAVLLSKSFETSDEVYASMQSRGFQGEVQILDEFRIRGRDWLALAVVLAVAVAAFWVGR